MNKQIALILLDKIVNAPYLDRASGIVQVLNKTEVVDDSGFKITKAIPYTSFATYEQCGKPENIMIPNSNFKSCLYFEDNGVIPRGRKRNSSLFESRLRLVVWLNTQKITGVYDPLLAGKVMADMVQKLTSVNHFSGDSFCIDMTVIITAILPQDVNIFSRYSYKDSEKPFLMMPYDFFAMDLSTSFMIPDYCFNQIVTVDTELCPPSDADLTMLGGLQYDENGNYLKL